jgi:imidazolonepropionase-like amidohydrolase
MPAPKPSRTCLRFVPLILLTLPAFAEIKVLKNFTLIDGTGKAPVSNAAMIIDNGRIQWVGPASQLKAPAGAENVDATGKYVMPGIINLHGHVGNVIDVTQNPKFFTRDNVEKNLKTYASYGVTTVVSLGTDQDLILKIRDEQHAGRPAYTRVYTAGQGFTIKGSVGGMPGVTFIPESISEIPEDISALAAKKVDIVKMWVDDNRGHAKKMPFEMAKAIIDNAHQHKLRVAAHVYYLADAKALMNAGLDAFAHSIRDQPVDDELIAGMKKHGTWQLAATLTREASTYIYGKTPEFVNDPFFTRSVSAKTLATLKDPEYQKKFREDPDYAQYPQMLSMAQKNLKRLVDAGVKYGFGTDTGPPGRFLGFFEQWEMELEAQGGLTPAQVIAGATKNAAEFLHAADLGTLEKGKWADLIVLEKNPLENIRNTRTIQAVYIAGNRMQ